MPTEASGPQSVRASALQIGARLGERYVVRGYLGEGGMGAVYRAFDEVLGIEIALKSVRGTYATDAHLRDEVRVAQRVTNPNVCRIYDLVEVEGRHFIKMEYIAGDTLAARIAERGGLGTAETIRIARAVADGLAAAHACGIIHRDLKPSNVMLAADRVVLMDFGLARAIADGSRDRAGTPSYMSPEQLAGAELDAPSDLFALGCLAYEMLVGKRAFELGSASYSELARKRAAQPEPDLRAVGPQAPRWLARAVAELLATERPTREAGLRRLMRGPSRALPIAIAAVALAGVGVGAWWWTRPAPAWQPQLAQLLAYPGNADAPSVSPDGRTLLISQDAENSNRWTISTMPIDGGELRQISPTGQRCAYARWTRDGTSVLMGCVHDRIDDLVRMPIAGGPAVVIGRGTPVDDCGDAIATVERDAQRATLAMLHPGGVRQVLATERYILRARCSPSGKQIAMIVPDREPLSSGALVLVDRDGKREVVMPALATEVSFTPAGTLLVVEQRDTLTTTLVELDLATRERRVLMPAEHNVRGPEVSADGTTLVFHRDITWMPIYEIGLDGERRSQTLQQERLADMVQVPGAHFLVAERSRHDTYDVATIDMTTHALRTLAAGVTPFPSRDGSAVYFSTTHHPPRLGRIPIGGGDVRELGELPGELIAGVDDTAGTQLLVTTPAGPAIWATTPDGLLARTATPGLVLSAAGSGWRAIWTGDPISASLTLIAPGQALTRPAFVVRDIVGRPAWVDDRRLSYCDRRSCKVLDVVSRDERPGPANPVHQRGSIAAGLDGQRWFFNPVMGQVSLQRVTNFNARR